MSIKSLGFLQGVLAMLAGSTFMWVAFLLWGRAWSHLADKNVWKPPMIPVGLFFFSVMALMQWRSVDQARLRPRWKQAVRGTLVLSPLLSAFAVVLSYLARETSQGNGLGQLAYMVGGLASALLGIGSVILGLGLIRTGKVSVDS